MQKRKCALYTRVSSPRQASVEEGSLKAQEARLKAYVKYQNTNNKAKWEIAGIYREKGRSGKDMNRPQFQQLLSDIETSKVNTVIITKIDRLTRSLKDFTNLWDAFSEKNINLISLNENFDTSTAVGRAMLQIVLVFAQLEREQTAERTAATMQYRAEQGLWNGGRIIGYDIDPDQKGTITINKESSELVKKAFRLCLEKGSAGQTQKILNELGYRMPTYRSRRGKKHGDRLFTKQTVINMLTNPVYTGKVLWAGKTYKARHKPIIDKKTYDAVQKVLGNNRKTRSNDKQPKQYVYLLQGILQCGKCGSLLTPKGTQNGKGKHFYYYQCTRNARIGKPACNAKFVPAKAIEDFIKKRVTELSSHDLEIDKLIKKAKTKNSQSLTSLEADRKNVQKRLETVKKKLGKLIEAVEDGAAFKSFKNRIAELEKEKKELEDTKTRQEIEAKELLQEELSADVMKETFKTLKDIIANATREKLKELYKKIIENIKWHEDPTDATLGHAKISYFEQPHLIFPEKTKSKQHPKALFAQCQQWLPRVDSNHGPIG